MEIRCNSWPWGGGGGGAASEKNLVKGKEKRATDEILSKKMQAEKKECVRGVLKAVRKFGGKAAESGIMEGEERSSRRRKYSSYQILQSVHGFSNHISGHPDQTRF